MLLLGALLLAQVSLSDEAGPEKSVNHLRCTGNGITCSSTSTFGTITVNGVANQAIAPVFIDAGVVYCRSAGVSLSGCIDGDPAGSQSYSGYKHHKQLLFADDAYVSGTLPPVGIRVPNGGIAARSIYPADPGQFLELMGRRFFGDPAGNVIVTSEVWRDGGYLFVVNAPKPCDSMMMGLTETGDLHVGGSYTKECGEGNAGVIRGINPISGARTLGVLPRYYLNIGGSLGAHDDAWDVGGTRPAWDGGTWVGKLPDGGTYWNHASGHGDTNIASEYPMYAGKLAELYNPLSGIGAYTDHRAFWDVNGAYSQNHALTLAQFPPAHEYLIYTSPDYGVGGSQQFRYGVTPGSQMWAIDQLHWYFSNDSKWVQFLDSTSSIPTSQLTGTVSAAQLPNPTTDTLGGVRAITCGGTDKLSAIGADGVPVCTADQPVPKVTLSGLSLPAQSTALRLPCNAVRRTNCR